MPVPPKASARERSIGPAARRPDRAARRRWRTAALAAPDGAIDWLCLPDYPDRPLCVALLDPEWGRFCWLGPADAGYGRQRYADGSAVELTTRATPEAQLELAGVMA